MKLIQEIARDLSMSEGDISRIISNAPRRYKVFNILKRGGGIRIIAQPARELKDIQRYLVAKKLRTLPIHRAAMAYVRGKNIQQNAQVHAKRRVILKLDFKDFFPSIKFVDLHEAMVSSGFSDVQKNEWHILKSALFWSPKGTERMCLSIGAPSSPFISNVVMYQIDEIISKYALENSAVYTRYADDLTISANKIEVLEAVEGKIKEVIATTKRPYLQLNEKKRGIYTKAGRRIVTGLTITPEGHVSLGRERKRKISAAVNRIRKGTDTSNGHLQKTRGWVSYASAVEPHFFRSLKKKYGEVVTKIMKMAVVVEPD